MTDITTPAETPEPIVVTVPESDIEDSDVFEELRIEAYKEQDPERRLGAFVALAASADLGQTDTRIGDSVLETVTGKDGVLDAAIKIAEEQSRKIRGSHSNEGAEPQTVYDFAIGADGKVRDIRKRTVVPIDDDHIANDREVSSRVPSGFRQNGASGRQKGPVDPRTRHQRS